MKPVRNPKAAPAALAAVAAGSVAAMTAVAAGSVVVAAGSVVVVVVVVVANVAAVAAAANVVAVADSAAAADAVAIVAAVADSAAAGAAAIVRSVDLFEAIGTRHSYRGEYRSDPVPREHLRQIVQAGIQAPSGCNAQTTSFIIVDDPALVVKVREIVTRPFLAGVPAFIVCVIDSREVYRNCSFAAEDCAASTENMLLAITALGYASVWLDGVLRTQNIKESLSALLGIPDGRELRILLPIGRAALPASQKERMPFEQRAWFNRYGA
jgi:nitroreductase